MSFDPVDSLDGILSRYGLQTKDLERECSQEVKVRIAKRLTDWKTLGRCLNFSKEKLATIDLENETEEQRKIALLEAWSEKEGQSASFLKLADALFRRQRRDLVELLCDLLSTSKSITDGVVGYFQGK